MDDWKWYAGLAATVTAMLAIWGTLIWQAF